MKVIGKVVLGSAGMALKKGSPYTEFMDITLMKIIESGQLERLKLDYEFNSVCDPGTSNDDVSLSYKKLFLLFVIMGGGMAFAFIVLTYEILKNILKPNVKRNMLQLEVKESKLKEISTQTGNDAIQRVDSDSKM